jgi:hypothetical protein
MTTPTSEPPKKKRVTWVPHRYACSAKGCAAEGEGARYLVTPNAAFFELPRGWFFTAVVNGAAFFCSPECTKAQTEHDVVKHVAWRVPCKHCGTSGMAMRINGSKGEAIVAPPAGWCGFLMAAEPEYTTIHLACSHRCLRRHARSLFRPPPRPPLRLV